MGEKFNNYNFKPPGAMHRARWMAKAIYCLKIFLFRTELNFLTEVQIKNFLVFVIKIYLQHWYTAANAIAAPNNDFILLKKLKLYNKENSEISEAAVSVFGRHLWYLSPYLAALAFFDENINFAEKRKMVFNLFNRSNHLNEKRIKYSDSLLKFEVHDLISTKSIQFFKTFNLNEDFLKLNPKNWKNNSSFVISKNKAIHITLFIY